MTDSREFFKRVYNENVTAGEVRPGDNKTFRG